MTIEFLAPLTVKLDGQRHPYRPGDVLVLSDDKGRKLLDRAATSVRRVDGGPCFSCGSTRRWLSIHMAVVCALCHPPVDPRLVVRWIGDGHAENQ